jgi:S-adenosylmethionine hydrolase
MPAVLALLTDFGTHGAYVAAMKGVILGICPAVALVDITHEIGPQGVLEAALTLDACYRWFPPETVFAIVVDPGVGTARRVVAVEAEPYRFVAPDNGLLTGVLRSNSSVRAVELTARRFWRDPVSATFEGRDRLGPVAAWLCRGTPLELLGPAVENLQRVPWPDSSVADGRLSGVLVCADHFGNVLSSIDGAALQAYCGRGAGAVRVVVEGVSGSLPLVKTYGDLDRGQLGALVGSAGWLELCVRDGSAAVLLGTWDQRRLHVSVAAVR